MSDLNKKTPVSILQEHCISRKMFPNYELIYNGVGTQNPIFTYQVQAGTLRAEGTGRSKQIAKHRAAEKMLISLKIINEKPPEEELNDEMSAEPAENFVGQLKTLCINLCYPDPTYHLEEAAGPPHSRVFKMICCVSQLQEFGISKTKKQAKHEAAQKMLNRLKELKADKIEKYLPKTEGKKEEIPVGKNLKIQNEKSASATDEEIIEKHQTLRPTAASVINKHSLVFYKDLHRAFENLQKTSPTLLKVFNEIATIDVEDSLSLIDEISKELEVAVTFTTVPSIEENNSFTVISMSLFPQIAGIGKSKKSAAFNLLRSFLFLSEG